MRDFDKKNKFYTKKKSKSITDFYLSNPNRIKKTIRIAKQSITVEKHNLQVSSRGLTLPELLTKLNHPVKSTKQKALSGILELTKRNTFENHYNIGIIANSTWTLRWNNDQKIRSISDEILKFILGLSRDSIWFYKIAIIYLTEGYSNPSHHIIRDALEFTDYLIKKTPENLHYLFANLINLILKINSPENTSLQLHLIHEITRIHSYKPSSFLQSDSLESLLFNANSNNNINFYQRTLELSLDVLSQHTFLDTNDDVIKRLKSILECIILIKESMIYSRDLINMVKLYNFRDCIPSINQLNLNQRLIADLIISQFVFIKWQIGLLLDSKSNLSITQLESESLCRVINSRLIVPLPDSINEMIKFILMMDNIDEFELLYSTIKELNMKKSNQIDTFGCLIELIIFAINQKLPNLLIEEVLVEYLSRYKSNDNGVDRVLRELDNVFRTHMANFI